MKRIKKHYLVILFYCFSISVSAQYIQVDETTYTVEQLVKDVLVNSTCAQVSNVTVNGWDFGNGERSYGYFSKGTSNFPFQNGIVLTTGKASGAQGPNNSLLDDGPTSWGGDSDLGQALNISNSINATVLEFDFLPLTSKISFDYIFSSEEYHGDAPCRYSDGFAFLLKRANTTDPYQNLAVLPNSNIPVKVTSVHPDIPGACSAQNEQYFDAFNGFEHPTNYNGQTVVMTAQSAVIPGTLYHIKLVIADEANIRYDSAIFLGGGSFKVEANLGNDRLFATGNPLCENETLTLDATDANAQSYQWYKDNILLTGETNPTYTVTAAGKYKVVIPISATCVSDGEITIEYSAKPVIQPLTLVQCDDDNDGISTFNLNLVNLSLAGTNPDLGSPSFFRTLAEAQSFSNPITNPTTYQNTTGNTLYLRAQNQYGCYGITTLTLVVSNNTLVAPTPLEKCDDAVQDGFFNFDLTEKNAEILVNLPAGNIVYYKTMADALSSINPIGPQYTNETAFNQTIYAKLNNAQMECYGIVPLKLVVHTFGQNITNVAIPICERSTVTLSAPSGFTYLWSTGATTQNLIVNTAGVYTVTLTNNFGCTANKIFTVQASGRAVITSVDIDDFAGNLNSITIHYTGLGNYQFSIDGFTYQDSPTFTGLVPGKYTVYVKDKNGCGITPKVIYVLDYPKFFTPNGDGYHETWSIPFLRQQYPNAQIIIMDRYGKIVHANKSSGLNWNGQYNGHQLPSSDYWFMVELEDGRTIKGHFALVR
ncbi:T9SS type B sorting domain-containing protein [Flavobacterium sp. '19STA2R22 D10 B1']|uniref:T9SS type B sorting domain-containing protein n=1 Tax=Flavobacterium aerium TaxID=3037261 RepID=UPI00278C69B1|nr:choice-of-anchor L domain-containing protein [Flavobacterium sp. '19STA2R22 D10 B1']